MSFFYWCRGALFFLSIVSYIYVTEELTPDYEEIIEFNQVHSVVNILDDVANSVGQSRADELLAQYAEENRLRVSVYQWESPELTVEIIDDLQSHQIYLDDSYSYFVVYGDGRQIFKIHPDLSKPIWEQLDFDETLLWVFFYAGFAIYSALMLKILSRAFVFWSKPRWPLPKGILPFGLQKSLAIGLEV